MLRLFAVLSLYLAACDALSLGMVRAPAPARVGLSRAALTMQEGEEPVPDPVPEPEPEPAAEPVVPEPVPEPEPEITMAEELPPLDLEDEPIDEASIAKEALKAEMSDGLTGSTRPDRAVVGEILLALEAQNPTRSPATSPLLNGKWKFVYASGASPGLKALQLLLKSAKSAPKSPSGAEVVDVQDTFLTISPDQPRATSSVNLRFLSFENTVKLACRLEAESAVRLTETYDAAESEYMSLRLPFQSPVEYKRSLLISYLDEELLVVRDSLGRPDVLMRCDEVAWASSSDGDADDSAPGAS